MSAAFHGERTARVVSAMLASFLIDPPITDLQRGYLSALLAVYRAGLGEEVADRRLRALEEMIARQATDEGSGA